MSKLLINEPPLQVLPTLAVIIGLNEAFLLQQVHYWLSNPKIGRIDVDGDGQKWVRNSVEDWLVNFPFWSESTVKRTTKSLRERGLLLSKSTLNEMKIDRTGWYRIDYQLLDKVLEIWESLLERERKAMGQNDLLTRSQWVKLTSCMGSIWPHAWGQNDPTNNHRLIIDSSQNGADGKNPEKTAENDLDQQFPVSAQRRKESKADKEIKTGFKTEGERLRAAFLGVAPPWPGDLDEKCQQALSSIVGWGIQDQRIQAAVAMFVAYSGLTPPVSKSDQKFWTSSVSGQIDMFGFEKLSGLYLSTIKHARDNRLTLSSPKSITNLMNSANANAATKPKSEQGPYPRDFGVEINDSMRVALSQMDKQHGLPGR